jgi:hypothetical protein
MNYFNYKVWLICSKSVKYKHCRYAAARLSIYNPSVMGFHHKLDNYKKHLRYKGFSVRHVTKDLHSNNIGTDR